MCFFTGSFGRPVLLTSNYFPVESAPEWCIYHYHVEFKPDIEGLRMRKALIATQKPVLGSGYIFDGMHLFMATRLQENVRYFAIIALFCHEGEELVYKADSKFPLRGATPKPLLGENSYCAFFPTFCYSKLNEMIKFFFSAGFRGWYIPYISALYVY